MVYKNYWMRNQSPENGSSIIPPHLQAESEAVSKQVRDACEELEKTDSLYREAILARISLGIIDSDSTSWESITQARNQAQKQYVKATEAWMNFVSKVNGGQ